MKTFTKEFSCVSRDDIAEVGSKNAYTGELMKTLKFSGVLVPDGFVITTDAFRYFINHNDLAGKLAGLMEKIDRKSCGNLDEISERAKDLIVKGRFPADLKWIIIDALEKMKHKSATEVSVRSSAMAEGFAESNFSGLHDSYLNVQGHFGLLYHVKQCFASLYSPKSIMYCEENDLEHTSIFMAVGVQQMVRADKGCSGIGFSLETGTDFGQSIYIAGMWGMGEDTMPESVKPDEFLVDKTLLNQGLPAVVQKKLGSKKSMMVYADESDLAETLTENTTLSLQHKFVLSDLEVQKLAAVFAQIEAHFKQSVNFEWAKDGINHQLYIIQATLKKASVYSIPSNSLLQNDAGDGAPKRELSIG